MNRDILQKNKEKPKKLSLIKQRKIIQLFNNLYMSGFTLSEMVDFLKKSQLLNDSYTEVMYLSLYQGKNFSDMLALLGFSDSIVTQLSLAEYSGNTPQSLLNIERYLKNVLKIRRKIVEVTTYPIILLSFLIIIMLGLKNYLLPQIGEQNLAGKLISNFPIIFLSCIVLVSILVLGLFCYYKNQTRLTFYRSMMRLPLINRFIKLYLTAFFAREWGNLLGQGLEMPKILELMKEQKSLLFREIGEDVEVSLLKGQSFHDKVLEYSFLLRELSLMIEYGEVKSKLGVELTVYAEEKWEEFFKTLTKLTQVIQPLVFVMVAFIVVMIYAAMLLPMYQNMTAL